MTFSEACLPSTGSAYGRNDRRMKCPPPPSSSSAAPPPTSAAPSSSTSAAASNQVHRDSPEAGSRNSPRTGSPGGCRRHFSASASTNPLLGPAPLRFCSISHTASLMKPAPSTLRRARGPGRRAMTPRSTCRSCSGSSLVIFSGQRQHQGSATSSSSLLRRRLQIGFEALLHPDQNRGIALPPPRNMILWVWPP